MDRRERFEDLGVALLTALEGWQAQMWTAMPGIVQSFDASKMTVQVKVAVQSRCLDAVGNVTWQSPLLVDCPVVFPGGGGFTLTFPVAAGDECLVVFSSRCIDLWWANGGEQPQAELRMHDLSDGFALVGVRSQPRKITVDTTAVRLRNDANDAYVEIQNDKDITFNTPGSLTINAGSVTINAQTTINGNTATTGTLTNNSKNVGSTHTHGGVQTGGGSTGAPN